MEIELEKIDNDIEVFEYTIRESEHQEDGETYKGTYFQARIQTPDFSEEDTISCSFSYYNVNQTFLGVDTDSVWAGEFLANSPYPVSFELSVPENTEKVKCQMTAKRHNKSIIDYVWNTFVFLIFLLLISSILNIWL